MSEDRVLTEHGPIARGLRHFKLYVSVALVVLALGNAFTLKAVQDQAHQDCTERNRRGVAAATSLKKLVEANERDGNPHVAAVWREYLEATRKTPIPKC